MKKLITTVIALSMILTLAACGSIGGGQAVQTKQFSTESITFNAPTDWIVDLDTTDSDGIESMRLKGTIADGTEVTLEIGVYPNGRSTEDIIRNLKFYYPNLQELSSKTFGSVAWNCLYCEANKNNEVVNLQGYYTTLDGVSVQFNFKYLATDDPLIATILSSVKVK
ncbi:MAG: hypothetical protein FWD43_05130 [Coriobacteriia bacterium]|nr:hypothetical protein [Coriobacteriia bacterium]